MTDEKQVNLDALNKSLLGNEIFVSKLKGCLGGKHGERLYTKSVINTINIVQAVLESPELASENNQHGKSAWGLCSDELLKNHNPFGAGDWSAYLEAAKNSLDNDLHFTIRLMLTAIRCGKYEDKKQIKAFETKSKDDMGRFCYMPSKVGSNSINSNYREVLKDPNIYKLFADLVGDIFEESAKFNKSEPLSKADDDNLEVAKKERLVVLDGGRRVWDVYKSNREVAYLQNYMDEVNSTIRTYDTANKKHTFVVAQMKDGNTSLTRIYDRFANQFGTTTDKDKKLIQHLSLLPIDNLHYTYVDGKKSVDNILSGITDTFEKGLMTILESLKSVGIITETKYNALMDKAFVEDSDKRFISMLISDDDVEGDISFKDFSPSCRDFYRIKHNYDPFAGPGLKDKFEFVRGMKKVLDADDSNDTINDISFLSMMFILFRKGDEPDYQMIENTLGKAYTRQDMEKVFNDDCMGDNTTKTDLPMLMKALEYTLYSTDFITETAIKKLKVLLGGTKRKSSNLINLDLDSVAPRQKESGIKTNRSELTIFVAKYNVGKTGRITSDCVKNWLNGDNTVILSGEDTEKDMIPRLTQRLGLFTNLKESEDPSLSDDRKRVWHAALLVNYCQGAGSIDLLTSIGDSPSAMLDLNIGDANGKLSMLHLNRKLDTVGLDYIDTFNEGNGQSNDWGRRVFIECADLARRFNCRMISAQQAKPGDDTTGNEMRGSKQGYMAARAIYNMEIVNEGDTQELGKFDNVKMVVDKLKDGTPKGTIINSVFFKDLQLFVDIDEQEFTPAETTDSNTTDEEVPF